VLVGALFNPAMVVAQGRLPSMEAHSRSAGNPPLFEYRSQVDA